VSPDEGKSEKRQNRISSQVPSTNSATLPVMPVSQVSLLEAYFNESDGRKQVYCRNVVDWCLVTRESD
jgi:hypothetical protein